MLAAVARALGQLGDARAVGPLIAELESDYLSKRRAAAELLVALYQSNRLDGADKRRILAQRDRISSSHNDRTDHYSNQWFNDCHHVDEDRHTDKVVGIGVTFPI